MTELKNIDEIGYETEDWLSRQKELRDIGAKGFELPQAVLTREKLRQEAIKWVKELKIHIRGLASALDDNAAEPEDFYRKEGQIEWIKQFFNITNKNLLRSKKSNKYMKFKKGDKVKANLILRDNDSLLEDVEDCKIKDNYMDGLKEVEVEVTICDYEDYLYEIKLPNGVHRWLALTGIKSGVKGVKDEGEYG